MIDALEAERAAAGKNAIDSPLFTCEPDGEKVEGEPAPLAQRTANESTP
ncbi:MAG TPA: hypothetical protein VH558_05605 [Pseudolabrys sp.]|jgi:hypothetical protein